MRPVFTKWRCNAARYPNCPFGNRDVNGDGRFDFADSNAFVRLLTGP